jgi:hypothetical protein
MFLAKRLLAVNFNGFTNIYLVFALLMIACLMIVDNNSCKSLLNRLNII